MISADTKWRSVVSFTHRPLSPQGSTSLAIEYEARWWMWGMWMAWAVYFTAFYSVAVDYYYYYYYYFFFYICKAVLKEFAISLGLFYDTVYFSSWYLFILMHIAGLYNDCRYDIPLFSSVGFHYLIVTPLNI